MSIKNNPNLLYATIGIVLLAVAAFTFVGSDEEMVETPVVEEKIAVSYTHLTLPTNREV